MKCIHCREETLKIQLKKGTTLLSASKVTANSNINSITRIVMLLTQNKKISAKEGLVVVMIIAIKQHVSAV